MTLNSTMPMEFVIAILLAALLSLFVMGATLVWAILKVRKDPYPIMLTLAIAVLTLVAILTFTLTKQNVLATLAGVGLGALAGSLTNQLSKHLTSEGDTDGRSTKQHSGHDKESPGSGT